MSVIRTIRNLFNASALAAVGVGLSANSCAMQPEPLSMVPLRLAYATSLSPGDKAECERLSVELNEAAKETGHELADFRGKLHWFDYLDLAVNQGKDMTIYVFPPVKNQPGFVCLSIAGTKFPEDAYSFPASERLLEVLAEFDQLNKAATKENKIASEDNIEKISKGSVRAYEHFGGWMLGKTTYDFEFDVTDALIHVNENCNKYSSGSAKAVDKDYLSYQQRQYIGGLGKTHTITLDFRVLNPESPKAKELWQHFAPVEMAQTQKSELAAFSIK